MRKAQGIVESVLAVAILMLVLGGSVVLLVMGLSGRKNSFDRRRATELADLTMEGLVAQAADGGSTFWNLNNIPDCSRSGFENYTCNVVFTNVPIGSPNYPNCGNSGVVNCAEAEITIAWQGKSNLSMKFNRFFSRE